MVRTRPFPPRRRGLTLVEALLVLIVVAVLIAIALPRYQTMKERALTAAMRSDLVALRLAEEGYFADHRRYATTLTELNFTPATAGVSIELTVTDPTTGWSATASAPFSPASGTCFLGGGNGDVGSSQTSGGVQCNSFVFETQARQQP